MSVAQARLGGDRPGVVGGLFVSATLAVTVLAVIAVGPSGIIVPAAVVAVLACLRWPAIPVAALVGLCVILEQEVEGKNVAGSDFYKPAFGNLTAFEMLLYLAVGAVALDCLRRRRLPPLPLPIAAATLTLAAAILCGSIVGYDAGAGLGPQLDGLRNVLPILVVPALVASVLPPGLPVRRIAGATAILAGLKGGYALVTSLQAGGFTIQNIALYQVTPNWLFLLVVLVVLACAIRRVSLPWWVWASALITLVGLLASLKRALWLGGSVAIVFLFATGLSRVGRRLAIPAVIVALGVGWLVLSTGVSVELQGPFAQRVDSLNPTSIETNAQDRYRLDERANVWSAIKRQPLTGLGQGIGWQAVHPVGIEHPDARDYVHFAVLWFWMKYTLLGAIGYVALMIATIAVGLRASRRHPDPLMSALALGITAAFVALGIAELTVTFMGADARFTVVAGSAIGVLAVLARDARGLNRRAPPSVADVPPGLEARRG